MLSAWQKRAADVGSALMCRTCSGVRQHPNLLALPVLFDFTDAPHIEFFHMQIVRSVRITLNGASTMDLKPKVKATADIKKNRLTITMSGNVDGKTLEKLYTDIRFCVCDLSKGFEVINNISQCNILYISSLPVYKKIIDYLISCNVGEIVRVAKDDHVSYKQIVNIFKNTNLC